MKYYVKIKEQTLSESLIFYITHYSLGPAFFAPDKFLVLIKLKLLGKTEWKIINITMAREGAMISETSYGFYQLTLEFVLC